MSYRDSSRIRLKMPNVDVDADGSAADDANAAFICVTGNFSWSGFTRQSIKTTCSESPVDGWDNVIHVYRAGRFLDLGTLTFDVDWDPAEDDIVNAAFRQKFNKNYEIHFPPEAGETAGPKIVVPGHFNGMTPITDVMADGESARTRATLVLKIAGDWTITDPT